MLCGDRARIVAGVEGDEVACADDRMEVVAWVRDPTGKEPATCRTCLPLWPRLRSSRRMRQSDVTGNGDEADAWSRQITADVIRYKRVETAAQLLAASPRFRRPEAPAPVPTA